MSFSERHWFIALRITFGMFVVWHSYGLEWSAVRLFAGDGGIPRFSLGLFPNVLSQVADSAQLSSFVLSLRLAGVCILMGFARRAAALWAWYVLSCLSNLAIHLSPPSEGYLGLMCILLTFTPTGEGFALHRRQEQWGYPRWLLLTAWLVAGVSYTLSGLDKLTGPLWQEGLALKIMLSGPLVRPLGPGVWISQLPDWTLQVLTWGAAFTEALFVFGLFNRWLRIGIWCAMTALHLFVLLILDITSVSVTMLLFQIFLLPALFLAVPRVWMQKGIKR